MALRIRMIVTVPKEILNVQAVRKSIANTLQRKTAPDIKKLFRDTTYGWANKPTWRQLFTDHAAELSEQVFASGSNADQYALVNEGAQPHMIYPVNSGFLKFQRGYRASTRPRVLSSRRNYRSGPYSFSKGVRHPGFEARKFDETIADEYIDTFRDDIQDAINSVIH